jgi:uncharacterized protein
VSRKIVVLIAAAALFAFTASFCQAAPKAAAKAKKMRILFQWTEGDSMGQWVMTKHANNLLDDLGQDNVQLEVLAYGMATFAVTKRPAAKFSDDIEKLTQRGVTFHVCHHAMDLLGVKEDELLSTVTPVKGAMYEIVTRYNQGWETLRP